MFPFVPPTPQIPLIDPSDNDTKPGPPPKTNGHTGPYYPGILDILKVKYLLQSKVVKENIPPEIVDLIIDAAEYWASSEVWMEGKTSVRHDFDRELIKTAPLCYEGTADISSRPLPHRTLHPCRKIVFYIESHDQGWGGGTRGSHSTSYTWFDAYVIPEPNSAGTNINGDPGLPGPRSFGSDDPHLLPTRDRLQTNKTAVRETQKNHITWHFLDAIEPGSPEAEEIQEAQGRGQNTLDGRRVRTMQVGDRISVWGRARFGGWTNHVESLSVRVFWAV